MSEGNALKRYLALLAFTACLAYAQSSTLTNDTIINMVRSGVPADVIIRTIAAADKVDFNFLEMQRLVDSKVPDDVIKAMAAKDKGRPVPGAPVQQPATPAAGPPAARAQPAPPSPRTHSSSGDRYLGRVDIRGLIGANGGPDRSPFSDANVSAGVEVGVGLLRNLAVTGTYVYDRVGSIGAVTAHVDEFMGGVRVPFPNKSRVTPYIQTSFGGAHFNASAFGFGVSTTKFAVAPGGGLDIRIARHFGVGADFRALKAVDVPLGGLSWQYRATGAFIFRF